MTAHFVNLLDELQRRSLRMASAVEDMLQEACEAVLQTDEDLARRVIGRDEEIDQEEVSIEARVVRLMTLFQPMGSDMRLLCTILKANNDLERIADCAVNIAERAYHLEPAALEGIEGDLREFVPVVRRLLHDTLSAFSTGDKDLAERVRTQGAVIDATYEQLIKRVVGMSANGPDLLPAYLSVLSVATNLAHIADHANNIAEDVIYLATGKIIRHRRNKS